MWRWGKIYLLVLLFGVGLFSLPEAAAQSIERVFITTRGDFELVVKISENAAVVLNDKGEVLEYLTIGNNHAGNDYFGDRVSNVDGVQFSYNNDGRIERLGNVMFSYYDSLVDSDCVKGKLRRVGNVDIAYADSLVDPDYMKGKVRRIGSMTIAYNESIIDDKYIQGKIKRIGSVDFKYFDSMFDAQNLLGKLKSGQMIFTVNGMQIRVRDIR